VRANKIALIALSVIALVGLSFSNGGTSSAAVLRAGKAGVTKEKSSYLAGYYAAKLKKSFTHIISDFTISKLSCSSEYAGYKVDHYVELLETYDGDINGQYQAGIDEFCNDKGKTGYNDWWSGWEGFKTQGGVEHGVEPGDRLTVSVTCLKKNRMEFDVVDRTHSKDSFKINAPGLLSVPPILNGAAVFSEAYGVDLYGPPDFDRVEFTHIEIRDTADSGGFTSSHWRTYEYVLYGYDIADQPQVNVQPTALSDKGEDFANDWLQYSYH
jgi:Peptidase A4 family